MKFHFSGKEASCRKAFADIPIPGTQPHFQELNPCLLPRLLVCAGEVQKDIANAPTLWSPTGALLGLACQVNCFSPCACCHQSLLGRFWGFSAPELLQSHHCRRCGYWPGPLPRPHPGTGAFSRDLPLGRSDGWVGTPISPTFQHISAPRQPQMCTQWGT